MLRIHAGITGVRPANPAVNLIPVIGLAGVGYGGLSIEMEFLDTQTNEEVAAFVDSVKGKYYGRDTGSTTYGHAEGCLRDWPCCFATIWM